MLHGRTSIQFRSKAILPTIAPDAEVSDTPSHLRKYRIHDGELWIGSLFLSPECAEAHPAVANQCEFVELSRFVAYPRNSGGVLEGLPLSSGKRKIFDKAMFEQAAIEYKIESQE